MIYRIAAVSLLWLGVAVAAPKADAVATATNLMAEAEFDKALAVLDSALKSAKQPADIAKIQLLRGQALVALNNPDAAVAAFTGALTAVPEADLDAATASPDAVGALVRARRSILSELTVAVAGGAKANIRLDDSEMGPAPLKTKVGAGKHRIEAVLASGEKFAKDIDVVPGRPLSVTLDAPLVASSLPPPPPPPPPTPAAEPTGTTPAPASATTVTRPAPRKTSAGGSKLGFLPLGVGVVGLGAGVVCVVMAQGNHQQLTSGTDKIDLQTENRLVNEGSMFQTVGWIGIGVGAAAAVAGTAMLLFMGGSGSGSGDLNGGLSLTASPTPTGGYVGISGTLP